MPQRRRTKQKDIIEAIFDVSERPLNAQEVLELAQADMPELGIATVYRNLKRLVTRDVITPVEMAGEPTRYERADLHHHHHFRCEDCTRVFDVPDTIGCHSHVEQAPVGFVVKHHEITLHGLCPECAPEATL